MPVYRCSNTVSVANFLVSGRVYTPAWTIERHGQAKILTQQEIGLLFNKGLLSCRVSTLFGVCLYTACRIAEACSLIVKDIYTNSGAVRSTINGRFRQHQRPTPNQDDSGHWRFAPSPDILAFPRRPDLFIPRPPPEPPLEAPAHQLSGSDFERSVRADRHWGSLHPQLPSHRFDSDEQRGHSAADYSRNQRSQQPRTVAALLIGEARSSQRSVSLTFHAFLQGETWISPCRGWIACCAVTERATVTTPATPSRLLVWRNSRWVTWAWTCAWSSQSWAGYNYSSFGRSRVK